MATKAELIQTYGNEAKTYFYLRELGWTHKGTCGVMGNINQESGFRTTAVSFDGYGSLGICQWTFGRRTNLEKFLQQKGYALDSLEGQCKFLDYETKTGYSSLYTYLTKETSLTVEEIADKFCREWERPAEWAANYARRESSAKTYESRYRGVASSAASGAEGVAFDFNKTVETLSSSDNFTYIQKKEEDNKNKQPQEAQLLSQQIKNLLSRDTTDILNNITDGAIKVLKNVEATVAAANVKSKGMTAKFQSNKAAAGSYLPIYTTCVEAPFGEVTIAGVKFGTYTVANHYTSYPNYIQSINILKTNGTLNEYTINLIHQISPGDNPNYIAELLSAQGYNKIKISYGDAASGRYFQDIEALLTDVKTSFDFTSNTISYTISASSLSYVTATTKLNFPAVTDKPSNVIKNLITDKVLALTDYFTGMKDINRVSELGLIPSNDKVVEISAVTNKTIVEYLSYLTALMVNENDDLANKSTYYLVLNDLDSAQGNTFKIKEIISGNLKPSDFMYEVDVGYPDKNMIFDFNVTTNYGWVAAYETANKIVNYNYDMDSSGNIHRQQALNTITATTSASDFRIDENTWKQLTRFPITATLTTKELIAPIMLLNYIRINNYYFGQKRLTSGLYIVTEQQDIISGNGCRTILGLTRVASDIEQLTSDGRVTT